MVKHQNADVVIVGGGIAGLIAALIQAEFFKRKVVLIEREAQVGGLLRCFNYGKFGFFDYGMHNMYETGIQSLDNLLFGLLPKNEWQLLEGSARDLAGAIFNGIIQLNSPFPDLRSFPKNKWETFLLGFFQQLESKNIYNCDNAWDNLRAQFGVPIAEVIDEILRKQYGKCSAELDPFATKLTTLSRVVMFSEQPFKYLIESSTLRNRFAWPEQRTLPSEWESGRKAYYPRKYGMYRVINALIERLINVDVEILTSAQVQSFDFRNGWINGLSVNYEGRCEQIFTKKLVWTSGLLSVAQMLGFDLSAYRFDPPRKMMVVNFLICKPPQMNDLYYLYCFEPGCQTFRITNFSAYCEGACRAGGWPISVELMVDGQGPSSDIACSLVLNELIKFGVIASENDVIFSSVEMLASGFPMPSVNNFKWLSDIRRKIKDSGNENLTLLGIMSEEDIFFQRDVLVQTWKKMMEEGQGNG